MIISILTGEKKKEEHYIKGKKKFKPPLVSEALLVPGVGILYWLRNMQCISDGFYLFFFRWLLSDLIFLLVLGGRTSVFRKICV